MHNCHNYYITDHHTDVSCKGNIMQELIGQRCTELERGARMVDAMITNTMLPEIGREFLSRLAAGNEIKKVHLSVKEGNFTFVFD